MGLKGVLVILELRAALKPFFNYDEKNPVCTIRQLTGATQDGV